ncbi:hypothetical protein [Sodalis glossinidius]|uniref:hypothetical protein n=1 Tax=Sodalis glossinidius TaxID=63612 RepID=UPI0002D3C4C6|nr:hypothetical protein [Sodalis glossinidius]
MVKQFETPEGARSADLDFSLVRKDSQFRVQQAENEKLFATNDAVAPVSQVLGDVAESGARLAQKFPGLTTAATQASLAITALGAAAAVKTGADLLLGKGGGTLTRAAGGVLKGAASKVGALLKGLPLLGSGLMALQGAQDFPLIQLQRGKDKEAEAQAGGLPPSPVPMPSVGALDVLDEIRRWLAGSHTTPREATSSATAPAATSAPAVNVSVTLYGREIATAVETRLARDGRRH